MSDQERIGKVLDKNRGKDFIERIINPWDSPVLQLPDGGRMTHYMSWGENEDGTEFYVYPNVMRDGEGLKNYEKEDAWGEAFNRGEYITFDNAEDADWFSKNYKQVWPEGMR